MFFSMILLVGCGGGSALKEELEALRAEKAEAVAKEKAEAEAEAREEAAKKAVAEELSALKEAQAVPPPTREDREMATIAELANSPHGASDAYLPTLDIQMSTGPAASEYQKRMATKEAAEGQVRLETIRLQYKEKLTSADRDERTEIRKEEAEAAKLAREEAAKAMAEAEAKAEAERARALAEAEKKALTVSPDFLKRATEAFNGIRSDLRGVKAEVEALKRQPTPAPRPATTGRTTSVVSPSCQPYYVYRRR